ncbi:hypothetical protein ACW9HR_35905 [Nocardia gipuzkoensis]
MTGAVHDWFTHSASTPPTAHAQINQHLDIYTATVGECAHTHLGETVSVCVSGSLARGEPAVRHRMGGFTLASDVDLIAVVDQPADIQACVQKFALSMLERHPDIDTTVFIVGRSSLHRVAGRFGADLHYAAARPLSGAALTGVAAPRIGKREGMEGVIHQLATIYCPDSPPAASPWRTKTVLEALRAVAAGGAEGPQRYSDLPNDPAVCELLDRDTVAALVAAREHDRQLPIPSQRAYELVMASACALFGVRAGHRELIAALHTCRRRAHLLDGFQHAVLAATIILYGPPEFRCSAAAALHVIGDAIDPETLTTAHGALESLMRISPVEFDRGIDHPNRVLRQHVQALRRDYYGWLGPHNFGAHPVADYHGPAAVTPSTARRPPHG